jgi:hypothetical protein
LIIEHPMDPNNKINLAGANTAQRSEIVIMRPDDYGTTKVPADFWDQWFAVNRDFPPVVSGAIFVAKSDDDLAALAKENAMRKTGFEAMPKTAAGVKPADKE